MSARKKNPELFIAAMATGATVKEAAESANVSRTTGTKWAKRYAQEIADKRADLVAESLDRMRGSLNKAAGVLDELLASECERTRLAAAKATFGQFCRLQDQVDFESRLEAIEEQQKNVA